MFALLAIAAVVVVAHPSATPGACPSPPGVTRPVGAEQSPHPCPSVVPPEIGCVTTAGCAANLVGAVMAASEGTIDRAQIEARPVLRPGEVLEDIPGLVMSQHSGEGRRTSTTCAGSNSTTGPISPEPSRGSR